jgi:hypothetical protein
MLIYSGNTPNNRKRRQQLKVTTILKGYDLYVKQKLKKYDTSDALTTTKYMKCGFVCLSLYVKDNEKVHFPLCHLAKVLAVLKFQYLHLKCWNQCS